MCETGPKKIVCVCVCTMSMWIGGKREFFQCSHSLIVMPYVQVYMLFHTMRFPKIQRYRHTLTSLHPTQTHSQTLSTDRVRKHRQTVHLCCCLWPVPVSVGFTGSFTPPCHASPHWRPLNTDSLYNHSSAWEEPSATHHTVFMYVYISNFTCHFLMA